MSLDTWRVKAYVEYELEAENEEEAYLRLAECLIQDLTGQGSDIRDVSEAHAEKISDGRMIKEEHDE